MRKRSVAAVVLMAALAMSVDGPWGLPSVRAAAPAPGPTFNDPTGSTSKQMAIINKLIKAIDLSPPGATIRMAMFSFTIEAVADSLIAAFERGVHVRLIMDDHERWPAWDRTALVLGSDPTAMSYALLCHRSCVTDNDPSYLHSKIYMFSSSGTAKRVVMVSSANPTYAQARRGWNNAYTIVGDRTIYNAFKANFEAMAVGALELEQAETTAHQFNVVSSGKHKAYFFPEVGAGRHFDTMYRILDNIECTDTAPGFGAKGFTTIKVAMYQWSVLRIRLARKLWRLDNEGCWVEIMFDPTEVDPEIIAELKQRGGLYDGPKLVPASIDKDGDGLVDLIAHDKTVLIDGVYAGDTSARVVFTGSPNWTNNALRYNNEVMLRISGTSTHTAYRKHYDRVRTWAKSLKSDQSVAGDGSLLTDRTPGPNEAMPPEVD